MLPAVPTLAPLRRLERLHMGFCHLPLRKACTSDHPSLAAHATLRRGFPVIDSPSTCTWSLISSVHFSSLCCRIAVVRSQDPLTHTGSVTAEQWFKRATNRGSTFHRRGTRDKQAVATTLGVNVSSCSCDVQPVCGRPLRSGPSMSNDQNVNKHSMAPKLETQRYSSG